MITLIEIIGKTPLEKIPPKHLSNIDLLLKKMNLLRQHYGKPMIVTSGYRTKEKHFEIYRAINMKRSYQGLPPFRVPINSKHLRGEACDILDKDGNLKLWCKENEDLLEEIGLFLEDNCDGWQHFQITPFASYVKGGSIWFKPY